MHVIWCGVPVLRVYGECVVVAIMCKLLQCFVHVYSVMYIKGILTWTYIYIWGGEREREEKKNRKSGGQSPRSCGNSVHPKSLLGQIDIFVYGSYLCVYILCKCMVNKI